MSLGVRNDPDKYIMHYKRDITEDLRPWVLYTPWFRKPIILLLQNTLIYLYLNL